MQMANSRIHSLLLAVGLLIALCPGIDADEVHLKSGGKLKGKVTVLGDKVKIVQSNGITATFPKSQVVKIVKTADDPPAKPTVPGPAEETDADPKTVADGCSPLPRFSYRGPPHQHRIPPNRNRNRMG